MATQKEITDKIAQASKLTEQALTQLGEATARVEANMWAAATDFTTKAGESGALANVAAWEATNLLKQGNGGWGSTSPPDRVDWTSEPIPGGKRYSLVGWVPTEDDLQRSLDLSSTTGWNRIAVVVSYAPPLGWDGSSSFNYSGGQITQGPLTSGEFQWTESLVGAAAIKGDRKVRFVVSDGAENSGVARGMGAEPFKLQYQWSPSRLDFATGNGDLSGQSALVASGTRTVFAIGNNADGNHNGDKWSLGWTYDVMVEVSRT